MTITITLNSDDIIDWRYTREHWRTTEMLECRGFTDGSSPQPIFSRWPGGAPGQGNQSLTVERLIADTQTDLNNRCGRRGAAADGIYADANGVLQMALDLELTLPTGYHVADFYDEYVAIDLTTQLRGLDLSDQLFVLRSVRLETGDDGTLRCVWTLRTATNGVAGVTYVPPQENTNDLPDWTFPPFQWDFPPVDFGSTPLPGLSYGRGTVTMFAPNSDGYLYYCGPDLTGAGFDTPPEAGGPRWQRIAMNFSVAGTPHQWIIDAFCPNIVGTGTEVIGWLVNHNTIYYVTDANTLTPTFTRVTNADTSMPFAFASSATSKQVAAERGTRNRLIAAHQGQGTGTYYTFTTDGVNWKTDTQLDSTNSAASLLPGLYVSGKSSLVLVGTLTTIKSSTDSTPTTGMFSDVPSGLDPGSKGAGDIYFPWAQPSDDLMYFGGSNGSRNYLYRGSYVNGTKTDVTPGVSGAYYGPVLSKNIAASPANRNRIAVVGFNALGGPGGIGNVAIFTATDGGVSASSWTLRYGPVGAQTNGSYNHIDMTDDNTIFAWGWGAIGVSYDFGQTWQDKRGNIPTDFPSAGRFVGIYGG